jgi:hypothetical protein
MENDNEKFSLEKLKSTRLSKKYDNNFKEKNKFLSLICCLNENSMEEDEEVKLLLNKRTTKYENSAKVKLVLVGPGNFKKILKINRGIWKEFKKIYLKKKKGK